MKNVPQELNEIARMMNRMKLINETQMRLITEVDVSNRVAYNDIIQLMMKQDFQRTLFYSIGYINSVKLPAKFYPTDINTQKIQSYVNSPEAQGDPWAKKLGDFASSSHWSNVKSGQVLNKQKKPIHYIETNATEFKSMISFAHYVLNWQNSAALGQSFKDQDDKEQELRRKHGFGKPEDEYPENDWRRAKDDKGEYYHGGTGARRIVKQAYVNNGSSYKEKFMDTDLPIYGDVDMGGDTRVDDKLQSQRWSLRQNSAPNLRKPKMDYYMVDGEGHISPIGKSLRFLITNDMKQVRAKNTVERELAEDEAAFVAELKQFNAQYASTRHTFILNQVAYIVATVKGANGSEAMYYVNPNVQVLEDTQVNAGELSALVNKHLNLAEQELTSMAG
jgi:hypothetical protein